MISQTGLLAVIITQRYPTTAAATPTLCLTHTHTHFAYTMPDERVCCEDLRIDGRTNGGREALDRRARWENHKTSERTQSRGSKKNPKQNSSTATATHPIMFCCERSLWVFFFCLFGFYIKMGCFDVEALKSERSCSSAAAR